MPAEANHYRPAMACLETILKSQFPESHLEITATGKFSNELKRQVPPYRNIIFQFLKKGLAPDVTGFVKGPVLVDFVVCEIKDRKVELQHIYQTRMYADLFQAKYAVLVSTAELHEELKRYLVDLPVMHLPAGKPIALARLDAGSVALVEWFPRNPFEDAY